MGVKFVRVLLGSEMGYIMMWRQLLPGRFAGLTSTDEHVVNDTLKWCKKTMETLAELQNGGEQFRSTWEALLWPLAPWPLECLIGLAEEEFENVPPDVLNEILDAFVYGGTELNENLFNYARRLQRLQLGGALGLTRQWHRAIHGGLLEANDVELVEAEDRDRGDGAEDFPPGFYKAKDCDFSLGEKMLEDFLDKNANPSPSPESLMMLPQLHHAMQQYGCDGIKEIWYPIKKTFWCAQVPEPFAIRRMVVRRCHRSRGSYVGLVWP